MGNPLNNVLKYIDPIGNAAGNAISSVTSPKVGAAPPGYNPASKPGASLQSPPPGGPPGAGGPSSGLFGAPQTPTGYAPNPFQGGARPAGIGTGTVGPGPSGPGAQLQPGGPGQVNAFRGGTPPTGAPPAMATGNQGMPPNGQNPQLQQQMAIAQMLRGPQMRPAA